MPNRTSGKHIPENNIPENHMEDDNFAFEKERDETAGGEGESPEVESPEDKSDISPEEQEIYRLENDAKIAALEGEVTTLKDQLLRTLAELENTRNRARRDKEESLKYAVAPFARDIVSVADNLRRALESLPAEDRADNNRVQGLVEGIEMTEKTLLSILEKHHITPINPIGEKLDPHFHEAMVEIPSNDVPSGHIAEVFEQGYRLHDRLLRPARVAVAKGEASAKK